MSEERFKLPPDIDSLFEDVLRAIVPRQKGGADLRKRIKFSIGAAFHMGVATEREQRSIPLNWRTLPDETRELLCSLCRHHLDLHEPGSGDHAALAWLDDTALWHVVAANFDDDISFDWIGSDEGPGFSTESVLRLLKHGAIELTTNEPLDEPALTDHLLCPTRDGLLAYGAWAAEHGKYEELQRAMRAVIAEFVRPDEPDEPRESEDNEKAEIHDPPPRFLKLKPSSMKALSRMGWNGIASFARKHLADLCEGDVLQRASGHRLVFIYILGEDGHNWQAVQLTKFSHPNEIPEMRVSTRVMNAYRKSGLIEIVQIADSAPIDEGPLEAVAFTFDALCFIADHSNDELKRRIFELVPDRDQRHSM